MLEPLVPDAGWEAHLRRICILSNFKSEFVLHEQIGSGKFSVVHRCVDVSSTLQYAVKIVTKKSLTSKEALPAFRNEIVCLRMMSDCHGVVRLRSVYEDEVNCYLVSEYLAGGELRCSRPDRRAIMASLLRTVAEIHERGIMHRDIKPANIVFRSYPDDPVIIDFGLATLCHQIDQPLQKCGTPGYDDTFLFVFAELCSP